MAKTRSANLGNGGGRRREHDEARTRNDRTDRSADPPTWRRAEEGDVEEARSLDRVVTTKRARRVESQEGWGEPVVMGDDAQQANEELGDETLTRIEASHPNGLTSQAILDTLDATKFKISEATLRKWVQIGLLPRSVRVGRKGKHQGSQGMYPASVLRQIKRIKEMMALDYTIEEIQREFLFARGDIEETERTLARVMDGLDHAIDERAEGPAAKGLKRDLEDARDLARRLLERITAIESRLTMQARLRRAAV